LQAERSNPEPMAVHLGAGPWIASSLRFSQ
jgi:hypothetical protein